VANARKRVQPPPSKMFGRRIGMVAAKMRST
jgi:hypothetical protein